MSALHVKILEFPQEPPQSKTKSSWSAVRRVIIASSAPPTPQPRWRNHGSESDLRRKTVDDAPYPLMTTQTSGEGGMYARRHMKLCLDLFGQLRVRSYFSGKRSTSWVGKWSSECLPAEFTAELPLRLRLKARIHEIKMLQSSSNGKQGGKATVISEEPDSTLWKYKWGSFIGGSKLFPLSTR